MGKKWSWSKETKRAVGKKRRYVKCKVLIDPKCEEKMIQYYAKRKERSERASKKAKEIAINHPELEKVKSERMKEYSNRPEIKKAFSEKMKAFWAVPWNREEQRRKREKYFQEHPEFREASIKRLKEMSTHPEERKRRSESAKKYFNEHPEARKKLSRLMSRRRIGFTNFSVSKDQFNLFGLIKQHYLTARLEYPVGWRFVDIAIPELKIDIEYDGAYWHQNPEKDEVRDKALRKLGWTVLRVKEGELFDIDILHHLVKSKKIKYRRIRRPYYENSLPRRT